MPNELRAAIEQAMESKDGTTNTETNAAAAPGENVQEPANENPATNKAASDSAGEPSEPNAENDEAAGKAAATKDQPPAPATDQPRPTGAPTGENVPGQHRVDRPPVSWRKEAKGEWAALPLQARQEILRREMEIQRTLNDTANERQAAQQFRDAVSPYMARIQSLGVSPQQAVGELLKADYLLHTGTPQQKAMFIDKLLQDYGVDINELDAAIARRLGGQPQQTQQVTGFDPNQINQLVQQQLQQALSPLLQQQQMQQQQMQQQATQVIEQMMLDPKYPHFEQVREDMADIMELKARRGVYISAEEAYNIAISQNSELAAIQRATQQNQIAQRAVQAAASVTGAPVGGGSQTHVSGGNLRADIEAAFGGNRA